MKYKLINNKTKEEHLCDKVTIDEFDYYVINDFLSENNYYVVPHNIEGKILSQNFVLGIADKNFIVNYYIDTMKDWWRKVIATNNPNIDVPQVVDKVDIILEKEFNIKHPSDETKWKKALWKDGYNKSQETHPFSEEDMIEFLDFSKSTNNEKFLYEMDCLLKGKSIDSKEILEIWKEQQPKIVYYE